MSDVFAIKNKEAIAVGRDLVDNVSIILKTIDNGINWDQIFIEGEEFLKSIYFLNNNLGYISGSNGTILKSNDAGETWEKQTAATLLSLESIHFFDENTGIAVGGSTSSAIVFRTDNGGLSWTEVPTSTTNFLQSVFLLTNQKAFAVGWKGEVLSSEDGGQSWTSISPVSNVDNYDVFFTDPLTGFIVGGDPTQSKILRTKDGGLNWKISGPTNFSGLKGVAFTSALVGYAVGDQGTILKTENGGTTTVEDLLTLEELNLYPNPVEDYLTIELNADNNINHISVFDVQGRLLKEEFINSPTYRSDLRFLHEGSYYLKIETDSGNAVRKINKL